MTGLKIQKLSLEKDGPAVASLEKIAHYPLGEDQFQIDHGAHYFDFFKRLGRPTFYGAFSEGTLAAVGAGILRTFSVPMGEGRTQPLKAWYLCDLKVHPDFRGRHLPLRMLSRAFLWNYLRCPRGYGISMNPPSGENRVLRLIQRFPWIRSSVGTELEIYSLNAPTMAAHLPLLIQHRGPVSFLSLQGKKDLILRSTGAPLPLLHAQFGPQSSGGERSPREGFTHMFCSPSGDALVTELHAAGVRPSARATVIQHGMRAFDWRVILTSEI